MCYGILNRMNSGRVTETDAKVNASLCPGYKKARTGYFGLLAVRARQDSFAEPVLRDSIVRDFSFARVTLAVRDSAQEMFKFVKLVLSAFAGCFGLWLASEVLAAAAAGGEVDFTRAIRPILSDHCVNASQTR